MAFSASLVRGLRCSLEAIAFFLCAGIGGPGLACYGRPHLPDSYSPLLGFFHSSFFRRWFG